MTEDDKWAAVGEHLRLRMLELGWHQGDLADAAGLSREGIRPFTQGRTNTRKPDTRAKVCRAVGWTADSIDRILSGGEPEMAEPVTDLQRLESEVGAWGKRMVGLEGQLEEIRDELRSLSEAVGGRPRSRRATGGGA